MSKNPLTPSSKGVVIFIPRGGVNRRRHNLLNLLTKQSVLLYQKDNVLP
jgi:hypothetical protein